MLQTAPLVHSADERIDIRDLAFATDFFSELATRTLG
jgi:acetylornithine deacetylase/succinyl-diaminopimelate desuccinylase-like protein